MRPLPVLGFSKFTAILPAIFNSSLQFETACQSEVLCMHEQIERYVKQTLLFN